ncbi:MAG TPA: sigma-70 family RNA polymerase sigma factor [Gammaproteobacteria bacterium]|nr:sigma-70 family RNA polymerase sigma factor [Gammaproteobacteria bacterium]
MNPDSENRDSFTEALTSVLDGLYGAALRLAKNRSDAEDLVAETAAKAWAKRASLKDRQCFRAWIFRILTNTFLSEFRKRALVPLYEPSDPEHEGDEQPFSIFDRLHQPFLLWWSHPEQDFLDQVMREQLERAIDALPECFRVAVILSDLEGFNYNEISTMLKIPVGTVRSRLARGRGLLQKALWGLVEEAGRGASAHRPADSAASGTIIPLTRRNTRKTP